MATPATRAHSVARGAAKPSGTLYLSSTQTGSGTIIVLDVARERTETHRLSELSPGDPPYSIAVLGRRLVVYGRLRTYAFGLGLREPGRSLGMSRFFLPAPTHDRLWLVDTLGSAREVTTAGETVVVGSARAPAWPIAAVDAGLLVQSHTLEVWQPASGKILEKLPGLFPLAIRHSLVVSCTARCRTVRVTNSRTGAGIVVRPGPSFHFVTSYDGAFSPDGRLVAVPVTTRHGRSRVAIVNITRRSAAVIPGAALASGYTLIAWASTGWLFYDAGRGRIAAYRPGTPRARLLTVHLPAFQRLVAN